MNLSASGENALISYFHLGYQYKSILSLLRKYHGDNLSLDQLQRYLKANGLKRKGNYTHDDVVRATIQQIIADGQIYMGYRSMWQHLIQKYHLHVRRDSVMRILKEEDPDGTQQRKSRRLKRRLYRSIGPNFTWHVDGYDKLKPFGFALHGCIDGFSRKLIWLRVSTSNNNPSIIARYFLDSVKMAKGVPSVMRCDRGTENRKIRDMQCFMRQNHDDDRAGVKSFIYGSSLRNQRIEAFWSMLRKTRMEKWISAFKDLSSQGLFNNADVIQRDILRFACMGVLQNELDDVVSEWNNHRIRLSRMSECPAGIPSLLYALPEQYGGEESLKEVSEADILSLEDECCSPSITQDPDMFTFLTFVMNEQGYTNPSTFQESINLYHKLVDDTSA